MSNFETFLIVMVCIVPFAALLFVLPKNLLKKLKKGKETKKEPEKVVEEAKKETPAVKEEPKIEVKQTTPKDEISTEDFKTFLTQKQKSITKPSKIEMPKDFKDLTMPYVPRRRRKEEKKPQSVAEEINNLSPELKAMLIAGVLDKKSFDN